MVTGKLRVITDLGVLDITESGFVLCEVAPGSPPTRSGRPPPRQVSVGADLTEIGV
ncbi:MAG TPA: hypothetical protein VF482_03470 [Trebonia sp.]